MPARRPRPVTAKSYKNLFIRRRAAAVAYAEAHSHRDQLLAERLGREMATLDEVLDGYAEHDEGARTELERVIIEHTHVPGHAGASARCLRCLAEQMVLDVRELTGGLDLS